MLGAACFTAAAHFLFLLKPTAIGTPLMAPAVSLRQMT